eukprot:gene9155-biopygen9477
MAKGDVVPVLVSILRRYDVVCIQEIRDSSGTAFPELVTAVNAGVGSEYDTFVTERNGRSASKEQEGYTAVAPARSKRGMQGCSG